jgi:hypothetical protein
MTGTVELDARSTYDRTEEESMKNKSVKLVSLLGIVIFISSACFFPVSNAVQLDPAAQTAAAQTVVAAVVQTQLAELTIGAPTPQQTAPATLPEAPTQSPEPTSTLTLTPEPSLTPTPPKPIIIVSKNTNCRTGNTKNYDYVGALLTGEQAEIIARDSGNYWYVRLPSGTMCWLWGEYGTITGDTSQLPVFTPPPSPTPAPDFTFSYKSMGVGPGYQCLLFDVKNTGSLTWESFRLEAYNTSQGVAGTITRNEFTNFDQWCAPAGVTGSLTSGSSGTVHSTISMPSNPSGNDGTAILTLCSQNGLAGQCLTKTITFTY